MNRKVYRMVARPAVIYGLTGGGAGGAGWSGFHLELPGWTKLEMRTSERD